jgi:hypothetical protein
MPKQKLFQVELRRIDINTGIAWVEAETQEEANQLVMESLDDDPYGIDWDHDSSDTELNC